MCITPYLPDEEFLVATNAITHEEYLERIRSGGIPAQPIEKYTACLHPILHKCLVCEEISSIPPQYYLGKKNPRGCPKCAKRGRYKDSPEKHLARLKDSHGNNIVYIDGYVDSITKCRYRCHVGHEFSVEPYSIVRIAGCPICASKARDERTREFGVKKLENSALSYADELMKRGILYVPLDPYEGHRVKIQHECLFGHVFHATPGAILTGGRQCPRCLENPKYYSREGIRWIEWKCHQLGLDFSEVVHAENQGEHVVRLPNKSHFRFDGFHPPTNTVFEYYDDAHHRNPSKYKGQVDRQIYKKTVERETTLYSMGYTVITVWASEWKAIQEMQEAQGTREKDAFS